jgi:molybdopterin synthase catalytic subunit/molybdopterin converting factor small subunit
VDVQIRLFAALRERAGTGELVLRGLPAGATVGDAMAALARERPELGDLGHASAVVGTTYVPISHRLAPGDGLALLPPVSGGCGAPQDASDPRLLAGLFELSAAPLDPGALHARLVHPSAGAVVLFTGTTRGVNRGQDVVRLDYEAFAEMAGPEMDRIFAECRARFGAAPEDTLASPPRTLPGSGLRMLCVHRTGTVGVAEASVVVGASSPHRDMAFAAARFLIDTLKERLPVWKKEVYGDGHHWIGDRS